MKKKHLYGLFAAVVLFGIALLFFVRDTQPKLPEAPTQEVGAEPEQRQEAAPQEQSSNTASDTQGVPQQVTVEGTFLSLVRGENRFEKTFQYLLLDDGSEVLRIDLRPLIGYSELEVEKKLGVKRGDRIRVTGTIEDGTFTVSAIEAQE